MSANNQQQMTGTETGRPERRGPVAFAVIGAGLVGPRHAEFATRAEGARLAVVCDLRADRGRALAEKLGAEWVPDYREVVRREDVEVVNVCLPTALHLEVATAAAEAGKHVVVEKPLELNVARARQLIDVCRRNGVKLAAIFNRRFVYGTRRTREVVQGGQLGRLIMADMRFKAWRPQSYYTDSGWRGTWSQEGGAALINQGIHGVDLITWIAGPITRVAGHARHLRHDIEADDTTVAVCEYENGALGVIECTTSITPRQGDWLELHGERGSILLENYQIHSWQVEGVEQGEPHPEELMLPGADKGVEVGHFLQVQDMADAVREGRDPVITGEDALHSLAVVQAIYESARRGGQQVEVREIMEMADMALAPSSRASAVDSTGSTVIGSGRARRAEVRAVLEATPAPPALAPPLRASPVASTVIGSGRARSADGEGRRERAQGRSGVAHGPQGPHGPAGDFGWFDDWWGPRCGVCVTFARGRSVDQLLAGLAGHVGPRASAAETFDEADAEVQWGRHRVRVGAHDGWAYAVEHFTTRGSQEEVLRRLSAAGGEAFALAYTMTISSFLYAADGELACGFDLLARQGQWGSDPHRFDAALEAARADQPGHPDVPSPGVTGLRLVRRVFGITLDRELLERPLPSFELLPQPGLV